MTGQNILTILLPLFLISIVIEALVLNLFRRRSQLNIIESLVNLSLGATNLVAGVLFTGLHLSVYYYVQQHWALIAPLPNTFLQILATFILYDFFYYLNHWVHHRCNLLWANHLVHHSGQHFNLSTAVRLGFFGNFTVWVFFLPMAFLGIKLEHYLLAIAAQLVYQFFIHTTFIRELGFLEKIFVTPSQHRVHHASNSLYIDKNFGCFLVIWDRIFGTYQRELSEEPLRYGITTPIAQPHSLGYLNSFMYLACLRQAMSQPNLKSAFRVLFGSPKYLNFKNEVTASPNSSPAIFTTLLMLISPTLISFYIIFNADQLNTMDAWVVPLIFLFTSCLYSSRTEQNYLSLVTLFIKALEGIFIVYLLTHYSNFQPLLWLSLAINIGAFIVIVTFYLYARKNHYE
ncbi:sterol desaturase family protein [Xenorhabdus budapestensis]|uniref:Sterol desaturase family protein n=1 Tax=Xenorhabdus budapestensis TaxID=290110 RepID=A0ABX7VLM7_XENBU|nr:sterol desaturase family protein [Xenorhabdus budapestensis]QTL40430.1 sterol desaturase family protein [Xenorhabdus budapestensis]